MQVAQRIAPREAAIRVAVVLLGLEQARNRAGLRKWPFTYH